jgi:hypothetical protein
MALIVETIYWGSIAILVMSWTAAVVIGLHKFWNRAHDVGSPRTPTGK